MYEKFYNLKARPFRLSPDPRFLFRSKVHTKALAYLSYGLQTGEGFIVITGGVGTGKTMLSRLILSRINKSKVIAVELVTSQLDSDDLLRLVASTLGLAHQNLPKSTLLRNIETFLMARAREGKRVLLLVDEVQNLSPGALEELRMLSNFQVGEKALLQSFLLGQDEFRPILQSAGMEQFRQRIIASFHLDPLIKEEVQEYIFHRLRLCGWKGNPQFDNGVFGLIHEHTSGVPRRINKLCDRVLLYGCVEESHHIGMDDVKAVIAEELKEIQASISDTGDPQHGDDKPVQDNAVANNVQPLRPEITVSDGDGRLRALEKKVSELEKTMRRDNKRFQRMLMMLAMSDDGDEEILDVLKDQDKLDKL
ncbi:MAG: XrtA-associated ATPase [Gammaproteobacteria bacterium]|nr:XrtA-associated ATPase [Gammaproteobacteria bacterium]